MLSAALRSTRLKTQFPSQGNSSTGILRAASTASHSIAKGRLLSGGKAPEVTFLSGDCQPVIGALAKIVRTRLTAERNESAFDGRPCIRFSNRKDRQKADPVLLLKTPNPSPMATFTEGPSHCSWAPVEQVMDRRTESAAGGSDAI